MNEEEKKAIRDLRNNIQFGLIGDGTSLITNETTGTVLNLLEKQQAEIEKLKTKLENQKIKYQPSITITNSELLKGE